MVEPGKLFFRRGSTIAAAHKSWERHYKYEGMKNPKGWSGNRRYRPRSGRTSEVREKIRLLLRGRQMAAAVIDNINNACPELLSIERYSHFLGGLTMKIRLLALIGLAISFAVPTFPSKKTR